MKKMISKAPLLASAALVVLLSACNEPAKPATDFSVEAEHANTAAGPKAIEGTAPVELPLDERKLSVTAVRECNLERANGKVFSGQPLEVSKGAAVILSGWVASADQKNVPATVDLRFVNTVDNRAWKTSTQTGGAREDVKKLLGGEAGFANPGYSVVLNASSMPTGTYRVYAVFREGEILKSCDNGRSITVID